MKKPGDRVDRYVVEAPLGAGGMGEVYEARDTRLGRRVALKLLRSDAHASANQRLLREAQAAAAFEHPNAVVVYDAGETNGEMYIAMELVRGRALRSFVNGAPDSEAELRRRLRWMIDAARALGAAHRAGLIHRDIKPDNIVVREDGATKVLDFGIARRQRPRASKPGTGDDALEQMATVTAEGTIVGTPSYWAPEQLRGEEIDGRADQFAWGVTVYELLAGAPPWVAPDPLALLSRILSSPPPPLGDRVPGLPAEVERTVLRALSKDPDARYATMDTAADDLEAFAALPVSQARGALTRSAEPAEVHADSGYSRQAGRLADAPGPAPRKTRLSGRWLGLGAAIAAGAIAVLAGTGVLWRSETSAGAPSAEIPGPLTVHALACKPASLHGDGATPELAGAIGVGACARIATDLGIEWYPPGHAGASFNAGPQRPTAHSLSVDAQLEGGRAVVTLSVSDRRSNASAATPMDALVEAAGALTRQLAPPPMTATEVAAWGARDAAGARRIMRVWRRMLLDFAPDDQAAARELLQTDPESPWTHYIALIAGVGGAEGIKASRKRLIELVSKLPRGRALLLSSTCGDDSPTPEKKKEALQNLRQAYAEAPDDPDLVTVVVKSIIKMGGEEGPAVLDRLYERFPAQSVWPMKIALQRLAARDPERERRYIEQLRAILPESSAWYESVRHAVRTGNIDEARRAVDMGVKLGARGQSSGSFYIEWGQVWFKLAMLEPKAARDIATPMLSVPREDVSGYGSDAVIATYVMEGRMDEAQSIRMREMDRLQGIGSKDTVFYDGIADLRQRMLLGQPPPNAERLSLMEAAAAKRSALDQAEMRLYVALARMTADSGSAKSEAERALKEIEAAAEKESDGDPLIRNQHLLRTIPAVRKLRGDADAVKRWKEVERTDPVFRHWVAFDAALALEAEGDLAGAEKTYKLAMEPEWIESRMLAVMAARVRLADLYRRQKRDAEAASLDAELDRVWAKADPGLREKIRAVR